VQQGAGRHQAQTGNLRDREIDKDDATLEHLDPERGMGQSDHEPGDKRRPDNADHFDADGIAPFKMLMERSNRANKLPLSAVPSIV